MKGYGTQVGAGVFDAFFVIVSTEQVDGHGDHTSSAMHEIMRNHSGLVCERYSLLDACAVRRDIAAAPPNTAG